MKIYILGCGALGSHIAMNLAFDRKDDELVLVDFDKVEARNFQFGTQQYLPEQLGLYKVDALTMLVYRGTRKMTNVRPMNMHLQDMAEEHGSAYPAFQKDDLVIDCLDNYDARLLAKDISTKYGNKCLHVGFSPSMTFEVVWNENYKVPNDTLGSFDICEAQGARAFIQHVAGLATSVAIEYLKNGSRIELVGNRFNTTKLV